MAVRRDLQDDIVEKKQNSCVLVALEKLDLYFRSSLFIEIYFANKSIHFLFNYFTLLIVSMLFQIPIKFLNFVFIFTFKQV
jgi:hypothetical protein